MNNISIKTVVTGLFEVNTYLVWCNNTNKGVIIDPGAGTERILREIEQNNIKPEKILITHAHIDHVQGLGVLKKKLNIPFVLGKNEVENYNHLPEQSRLLNLPITDLPEKPDILLQEGEEISFCKMILKTMELPGHTAGSIAFYNDNTVFSGDVIFFNSIGRTDLPGGDYKTLLSSIRNKLFKLDPLVEIYPGHGIPTTIAAEIEENPFL